MSRAKKFVEDYNPQLDLKITCPGCDYTYTVGKLTANKHQVCPICKNSFDIPNGVVNNPDPDFRTYGNL